MWGCGDCQPKHMELSVQHHYLGKCNRCHPQPTQLWSSAAPIA